MKNSEYFTISHYLPEGVYQRNNEMTRYLRNAHFTKHGVVRREAEQRFVKHVQAMKEYGLHLYSAVWVSNGFMLFSQSFKFSTCPPTFVRRCPTTITPSTYTSPSHCAALLCSNGLPAFVVIANTTQILQPHISVACTPNSIGWKLKTLAMRSTHCASLFANPKV